MDRLLSSIRWIGYFAYVVARCSAAGSDCMQTGELILVFHPSILMARGDEGMEKFNVAKNKQGTKKIYFFTTCYEKNFTPSAFWGQVPNILLYVYILGSIVHRVLD